VGGVKRPLPTEAEAREILSRKRTRPVRRPPAAAGRRLTKFIKALDERFGKGAGGLQARWREIAGETLFRATEPIRLIQPRTGGPATLEIKVEGPAAALIQHQAPQIMQRANMFLGDGAVGKLRIVQGPIRRAAAMGKPSVRKRPPLDAAKEARLAEDLAQAKDEKLKAALLKLGREVLRQSPH
jgi:hypothetical protein